MVIHEVHRMWLVYCVSKCNYELRLQIYFDQPMRLCSNQYGRVAKWLERLTAEPNMDGSSRTLGPKVGYSLTVHPAANGYPVATLGKIKAARKGTGHPTSLCRRLRISILSDRHSPTYGILWDCPLPLPISVTYLIISRYAG